MAKITNAGLALIAQLQAAADTLVIDKMIYANIDGLDPATEPPATEVKPDAADIVRESVIANAGYVDPNTVVYSDLLDATIGDFDFNWIGLYCSEFDVLVTVSYIPLQSKYATAGQNVGNTLCKNVALNYTDVKDLTGIVIQAATWQQDLSTLYEPLGTVADHEAVANPHPQYARIVEDFVKDLSTNGYQMLPSGLIIQWGYYDPAVASGTTITFPIAFPNACLGVQITDSDGSSGHGVNNITSTNFQTSSPVNIIFGFIAIGY